LLEYLLAHEEVDDLEMLSARQREILSLANEGLTSTRLDEIKESQEVC